MTDAKVLTEHEEQLWEDFHNHRGDSILCNRKALEAVFPNLIPEGIRRTAKVVPVERAILWRGLTGKTWKKMDFNT